MTNIVKSATKFEKLIIGARFFMLGKGYYKGVESLELASSYPYHVGVRKDGVTPEFQHQLEIFHYIRTLLPSLLYPEETLTVAILHDITEDYGLLKSIINEKFGSRVAHAVDLVDKNGKEPEQFFNGIASCPIASIVKGSDRIHNLRTMAGVFSTDKELRYVTEVEDYYLPMIKKAKRLFIQQEAAYENIKTMLSCQIEMTKFRLDSLKVSPVVIVKT